MLAPFKLVFRNSGIWAGRVLILVGDLYEGEGISFQRVETKVEAGLRRKDRQKANKAAARAATAAPTAPSSAAPTPPPKAPPTACTAVFKAKSEANGMRRPASSDSTHGQSGKGSNEKRKTQSTHYSKGSGKKESEC